MKIRMEKHFQGRFDGAEVQPLQDGKAYKVGEDVSENLANWLLEHHFAQKADRHFGSQDEPELKHDDVLAEEVQEVVEYVQESAPEEKTVLDLLPEMEDETPKFIEEPEEMSEKETEVSKKKKAGKK